MRVLVLLFFAIPALGLALRGQSEGRDTYSISLIRFELEMRSGGKTVIHSVSQKRLRLLGDGVSIALLKILTQHDLTDPETIKAFLPIIRDSFGDPQSIELEVDKTPTITLFLLNYLEKNVADAAVLREIRETEEFIKQKVAP